MIEPIIDDILTEFFLPLPHSIRVAAMIESWSRPDIGTPYPAVEFNSLYEGFSETQAPSEGISFDALLDEIESKILPNTPKLAHPMYIGHMTQALPWFSSVIESLTAALNQNQVKIETAFSSTLVEKQVLAWLHGLVYGATVSTDCGGTSSPAAHSGNLVGGGTIGNLTALAVALEDALPGMRENGLPFALNARGFSGLAVLGSARMHYSLKKAMATLGMGAAALHIIPVDSENRILLDEAKKRLDELRAASIKVIAIIGVAGATETGSIDPLPQLADLAREAGAWFHVDAAWGGALLLGETERKLLEGIERADSVVLDGHKLFFVPMSQGAVLFKRADSLDRIRHHANYILRPQSDDLGQTSLEGSRRFDAFKLWASIKLLGRDGYSTIFRHLHCLSRNFSELVQGHPDFEQVTVSSTFIYTYRYFPVKWRLKLDAELAVGRIDAANQMQLMFNEINVNLQERLKVSGKGFVSRTVLESTSHEGSIVVLRVVLTNVFTTLTHLSNLLQIQSEIGGALLAEELSKL